MKKIYKNKKIQQDTWIKNNPNYSKKYNKKYWGKYGKELNRKKLEYKAKLRHIILDYYGCKCNCLGCSETNPKFLSIDHVNNDGYKDKTNGKRLSGITLYSKIIKEGFPDKYQILCYNCNLGRAFNGGTCPHNE